MYYNNIRVQGIRIGVQMALLIVLASTAWSANIGPDAFGYLATENIPYSFVDISSTGVAVLAGADDDRAELDIGFPFAFYGYSFTRVCVSSNGLLSFGGCNPSDFANQDLTSTETAGNYRAIAPLWSDLTFAAKGAGAVRYQTLGQAGSRQFVVQWNNAFPINGSKGMTFQVILYEGNGRILFQYLDVDAGVNSPVSLGGGATIGIRDVSGQTNGRNLQWSYKARVLHNAQAIAFIPSTVPPVITGMPAPGCTLWPPNNRLVKVATVSAGDMGSGLKSFVVAGASNEPEGNPPDIVITGSGNQYVVQLRAQRGAKGTGRMYTITATAANSAGDSVTATSTCAVPHDQGK